MDLRTRSPFSFVALTLPVLSPLVHAQEPAQDQRPPAQEVARSLPEAFFGELKWRCVGPTNMSGRIVDLAVDEKRPSTFYAATASGGLLKTVNHGTTWEYVFEREGSLSLGDVTLAPSNPSIVWIGTGEGHARNSVSWGDGVYKSVDAGKTWQHMGLPDSFQIARIAIHPTNPDIVFVAALGRLWGPNKERGLYKTTDGGKTWRGVLTADDRTGCVEVAIDPADPRYVYAALYERARDWQDGNDPSVRFGEKAGLFRSMDGGETWTRLTKGLPTCKLGRIGLDIWRKDPRVLFAIVESERIGQRRGGAQSRPADGIADAAESRPANRPSGWVGLMTQDDEKGVVVTNIIEGSPADQLGLRQGDVVMEAAGAKIGNMELLTEKVSALNPGDKLELKWLRDGKPQAGEVVAASRPATPGGQGGGPGGQRGGGQRGGGGGRTVPERLGGQNANVMDLQGPEGFETGGIYRSDDRGETWTRINSLNIRPMYFSQIRVDPSDDQRLYSAGMSLHMSTDGGKNFRAVQGRIHADFHAMWIDPTDSAHVLTGCDGGVNVTWDGCRTWQVYNNFVAAQFYHVAVDNQVPYNVFGGLQDNGTWGGPSQSRYGDGVHWTEWFKFGQGDGFRCAVDPHDNNVIFYESQYGALAWTNLATREGGRIAPSGNNPSPAAAPDPAQEALGEVAQQVQRGANRYRFNWNTPFQLSHHNSRVVLFAANQVFRSLERGRNTVAISPNITRTDKGTATALAESPRNPDVIYVGTDDGLLQMTRDGGKTWKDITANLPGVSKPMGVSHVEPSRHREGRVYVTLDSHREDIYLPQVFVSENFGGTFTRIEGGLPKGHTTRVIIEDLIKQELLFLGTEFGAFASLDRGKSWTRINQNLPVVPVHHLVVHPRDGDLVAATHGRGIWITDVQPYRELCGKLDQPFVLLGVKDVLRLRRKGSRNPQGNQELFAANPAAGALLYYYLREEPAGEFKLTVEDPLGQSVRDLRAKGSAGLHVVPWNLNLSGGQEGQGRFGGGGGGRGGRNQGVPDGDYVARLKFAGDEAATLIKVRTED